MLCYCVSIVMTMYDIVSIVEKKKPYHYWWCIRTSEIVLLCVYCVMCGGSDSMMIVLLWGEIGGEYCNGGYIVMIAIVWWHY